MTGLETALPILIETMVNTGRMTWADIARVLSTTPAKIGRVSTQGQGLVVGALANITLVDPSVRRIVDPATQQSRSSNSPYRGMELPGQVLYTFHRGESTVLAGELISKENR